MPDHPPHDAEDGTGAHRPREPSAPPGPAADFIRPAGTRPPAGPSETTHDRAVETRLDNGDD